MKVAVTGGTGFVGRQVVRCLLRAGHRPVVLARHGRSGDTERGDLGETTRPELRKGDILDWESLSRGLEGAEAVIHLVGIISEAGRATFENIHVRGTQNMIEAAQRAGTKVFIHMSALGTRERAESRYHRTKWAAEEAVRQSGLEYVIFRPSLIYGPEDHFVNLFARLIRLSPVVPVIGPGLAQLQPVAVECVAQAFTSALASTEASKKTWDLCGPERLTLPAVVDAILEAMGKRRLKVCIPIPVARLQARLLETVYPALLGKAPPLNRDQIIMLQEDNVGDPGPADRAFQLSHPKFQERIREYLCG